MSEERYATEHAVELVCGIIIGILAVCLFIWGFSFGGFFGGVLIFLGLCASFLTYKLFVCSIGAHDHEREWDPDKH